MRLGAAFFGETCATEDRNESDPKDLFRPEKPESVPRCPAKKTRLVRLPWVTDAGFTFMLAIGLHLSIPRGLVMKKSLLVLLSAGLLGEIAVFPLVGQSHSKQARHGMDHGGAS